MPKTEISAAKAAPGGAAVFHTASIIADAWKCVETDAANPALLPRDRSCSMFGNVWPGGTNGRFAYCFARSDEIHTIVDYFPGYPARGATYCMAMANKYKQEKGIPFTPVQAPEMETSYYFGLQNLFKKN